MGAAEASLRRAFAELEAGAPALCIVDDLESVGRRGRAGATTCRLRSLLCALLDDLRARRVRVIVVAAARDASSVEPALCQPGRLEYVARAEPPSTAERQQMLEHLARGMPRAGGLGGNDEAHREPLDLGEVARRTHGFVGADLQRVCQEAAVRNWSVGRAVAPADFEAALEIVRPSALTVDPLYVPEEAGGPGIAGLGGVAAVWEELMTCVLTPLTERRLFAEMHVSPPRGVVLHGPAGCGKTALAHAAAHAAARHARLLNIKCTDIVQALVGASERTIAQIFATARRAAPCIVLLDQIDVLAPTRRQGGSSEHTMDRILSALLVEMDGLTSDRPSSAPGSDQSNVLVIATAADLSAIDAAMLRPGPCHGTAVVPSPPWWCRGCAAAATVAAATTTTTTAAAPRHRAVSPAARCVLPPTQGAWISTFAWICQTTTLGGRSPKSSCDVCQSTWARTPRSLVGRAQGGSFASASGLQRERLGPQAPT